MFSSSKTPAKKCVSVTRRFTFLLVVAAVFIFAAPGLAFSEVNPPYFVWWGNPKDLTHANIAAPGPAQDNEYWQNRGGLNAGHIGIGRADIGYFDHGMTDQMRQRMEELVDMGYKSISLEIERETDLEDAAALRDFKAAHPDVFVVAWLIGMDEAHNYPALNDGIDLFMYEVYINWGHSYQSFDDFINLAKKHGILEKSVFALGTAGGTYGTTAESMENQIAYIRKRAPQMPGVAFCAYTPDNIPWSQTIDSLAKKYFLDPVLSVKQEDISFSNPKPKPDETTVIKAQISNDGQTAGATTIVDFYDGNPDLGGVLIDSANLDSIPPNTGATASINWPAQPGIHDIHVKIRSAQGSTILEAATDKTIVVSSPWWNSKWKYRVPITVPGESHDRQDMPIDYSIDFSALLASASANGPLDPNSIRVVEYARNGADFTEIPSQFEPGNGYDKSTEAKGALTWILNGHTPKGQSRHFYLYFDTQKEQDKEPPDYPSVLKHDNMTFSNDYYAATLDANRGFELSKLLTAPSGQNVMGANGWSFRYASGEKWLRQSGAKVISTKTTKGGVYTKFEVDSLLGLGQLKTTYYFYGRSAPIKIQREWGPAPGLPSFSFDSAVEMTSGIPQRGGTWQSGHLETELSGPLLENNVKEFYFGGRLGPGYEHSAGWFDWSWSQEYNGGFGVAVKKRWPQTASFIYDLTRYYDAQDYLQIWQVTNVSTTLEKPETSELYLVPHNYRDFTNALEVSPTYKVWKQAHNKKTTPLFVETEAILGDGDGDAPAPVPTPAPDPEPEPGPTPDPPPDQDPGQIPAPVPEEPPTAEKPNVDSRAPSVKLFAPRYSTNKSKTSAFKVRWMGQDTSGIESYTVSYRVNNSSTWRKWKTNAKSTHGRFKGSAGKTYYFKAEARDKAGNIGKSRIRRTIVPNNENRRVAKRNGFRRTFSGAKSDYYKQTVRYSKVRGDSITYRFRGRSVALISTKGPKMSKAKIFLDGKYKRTIDTHSSKTRTRRIVFSKSWKKKRVHKIKIVNLGTRGRARFDVDAIAVRQ